MNSFMFIGLESKWSGQLRFLGLTNAGVRASPPAYDLIVISNYFMAVSINQFHPLNTASNNGIR
jgi:hypothetical protein